MKTIKLPFGKEKMMVELPEERIAGILESAAHDYHTAESETDIVRRAVEHPIHSKPLRELVKGKQNIVLIASDHTRPVPSKIIMPVIMEEIKKGNKEAVITILIATGFHRPTTREELIYKFGEDIVNRKDIKFCIHKGNEEAEMVNLGTLPSGGELNINQVAANADLLLAEGFIEPHFFAGYSGGRKSVLPGVSSAVTVMANHCSEFIDSAYARTGILDGNPIHKDMIYAAETAKLAFIVNVVLDGNKKVIKAYAGHFDHAHREGCKFAEQLFGVDEILSDIVISTNGGYPLDQNVYQSVKGMTAAEATCKPGGVIIMVTSCVDGHGGQSLYDTFSKEKSKEKIMNQFLTTGRNETIPDQWEAQILCRILLNYKVIMVTQAPKQMIEEMQMSYANDVTQAIKMADEYLGNKTSKITVIPDGVSVIVKKQRG